MTKTKSYYFIVAATITFLIYIYTFFTLRPTGLSYISAIILVLPVVFLAFVYGPIVGTLISLSLTLMHVVLVNQFYTSENLFLQRIIGLPIINFIGFAVGYARNASAKFGEVQKQLKILHLGLEKSQDIVFTTDENGEFEYVNPAFLKIYGYTLEEIKGKTPRIFKSGFRDQSFYKDFWSRIKNGESLKVNMLNKTKSGNLVFLESTVNPVVEEDGVVRGFLAIQRDITQKKMTEDELFKKTNELEKLNSLMVDRELKMIELKRKIRELTKNKDL